MDCLTLFLQSPGSKAGVESAICSTTYLQLYVILQDGEPGLLLRGHSVTEGLLGSPEDLLGNEALTAECRADEKLFYAVGGHSALSGQRQEVGGELVVQKGNS